jgi:hypothetical protein
MKTNNIKKTKKQIKEEAEIKKQEQKRIFFETITKDKEKLFDFTIECPMHFGEIVSLNNVNKWYRYQVSNIKNRFQDELKEWCIPEATEKRESLFLVFEVLRQNKRKFDSDAIGFHIKWIIDAIKKDWLIDDDQIFYLVIPSKVENELNEASLKVSVFDI